MLFEACDSFVKNIDKYNWALLYESDFRSAIYAELIKCMDEKQISDYRIWTEYKYGDHSADIALGIDKEVAIETKFAYTYFPIRKSDLLQAKNQLVNYLENGAKKAYILFLEHQIPPESEPLCNVIDLKELGLTGECKEIDGEEISGDMF
ncbi:MAG: hypothetical protein ACFFDN_35005, partial [Candidatus Hodarchaeota archaeon]